MIQLQLPKSNCSLCPRLVDFRELNQKNFPNFHNGPVKSFGSLQAQLLIVGLAPGLKGANRTGRPFTGDYAGDLLYSTLIKFGLAKGSYKKHALDGLKLQNCRLTNAVRCVPPQNKPIGHEVKSCRNFLINEIDAMPNLHSVIVLGGLAHNAFLSAVKAKKSLFPFGHSSEHQVNYDNKRIMLTDSYHCSRYNTNTGRLNAEMFENVFKIVLKQLS
ncbi:MAG: uracil-DNA glycosylase [Rhodospirillaceae bacterium]|nr:uracil-DNA glycosylase [Rhodospirillaceae bacterium]|tara:strand:+ start:706 stop:1353 length:648 start_codon:yes stop_codon:yes gene_type:complete